MSPKTSLDDAIQENPHLSYASESGHFNIVKYLIEKGVDIDEPDDFVGRSLTLDYIYSDGATTFLFSIIDDSMRPSLHRAKRHSYTRLRRAVCKFLIDNGADVGETLVRIIQ